MVFCNLPFYFHSALNNYLEHFGVYLSFPKSWYVQEYLPKLKTILSMHIYFIFGSFEEGRVISEILQEPIHRASVAS